MPEDTDTVVQDTIMEQEPESVALASPVEIVARSDAAAEGPPTLPPRDEPDTDADGTDGPEGPKPPAVPPRENTAEVAAVAPPQLPPRSPVAPFRDVHVHRQRRMADLNASAVQNTAAYYLIKNHVQVVADFAEFIKEQDIYKVEHSSETMQKLSTLGEAIDQQFWQVLLTEYEKLQQSNDALLLGKIEAEFQALRLPEVRRAAYLRLSGGVFVNEELYSSLEIDLSDAQTAAVHDMGVTAPLATVISKLATVNDQVPSQFVVEFGKLLMGAADFAPEDAFKVLISLHYQVGQYFSFVNDKDVYSSRFFFQLARGLEDHSVRVLLALTKVVGVDRVMRSLSDLMASQELWRNLFAALEEDEARLKICDSFILKGFETIAVILVTLFAIHESKVSRILQDEGYGPFARFVESEEFFKPLGGTDFYRTLKPLSFAKYDWEFKSVTVNTSSMTFSRKAQEKYDHVKTVQRDLLKLKEQLTGAYTQILSNYQQLNEEKFTNESYIKSLSNSRTELVNQKRQADKLYNSKTQSLDVLKVNAARNDEIDAQNEALTQELRKITAETEELKIKLQELKESRKK